MEIENLENKTSKLVITKRKSKKRNKNKQQSDEIIEENGHEQKVEQVTATIDFDTTNTLATNSSLKLSSSSSVNDCANKNLEDNLKERLHINSNGNVLINGDHCHDNGIMTTNEDDQTSLTPPSTTMSNSSSPISKKCEQNSSNSLKIESSDCNSSKSKNIICREPSDDNNHKINENGCEINNPQKIVANENLPDDDHSSTTPSSKQQSTSSTTCSQPQNTESTQIAPTPPVITYKEYESELQMPDIMRLIQKDLSEPYSIYTYRYFIHNWPNLCFLAYHEEKCVGSIVCKLDMHRQTVKRGYIAMLAVDKDYRKLKIGSNLVQKAIQAMLYDNADEVVLETEITNIHALKLYENLGFVRDKRLVHYYLNGVDALRLKLWFR